MPNAENIIAKTLENPDLPLEDRLRLIELLTSLTQTHRKIRHAERMLKRNSSPRVNFVKNYHPSELPNEPVVPLGKKVDDLLEALKKETEVKEQVDGQSRELDQPA